MRWLPTSLGNVLALEYGKALPRSIRNENGNIPVAGSNGGDGLHDIPLVSGPGIVVGRKGSAGKVTWFDGDFWPIDTTYFIRHNPQITNLRWLYYLLIFNRLERLNKTTGVPGLNRNDVYREPCILPPPSEQRRIVEILDEADRLRRLRREADAKAARILPILFLKMFGDPATNPKGWPRRELREFVKPISRKNPALKPDQPFQYLDIAGIDGNQGMVVESRTILGREAPSRARQEIKWRDVVVSTVRPYLRATALVPQFLDDEIASTGFCVLRSHNSFGFGWLYALTRQMWFTEQLNIRARGASYPAVTDNDIFSLIIPLPNDENLLSAFDSLIADIQSLYEQAHRASDHIEKLFSLLLERAFSGQLTAKWREAHIKELLAEMEQQARLLNLPLPKELEAAP